MEVFGIDFGTTNSATIGIIGDTVTMYGDGSLPFPSVVAIDKITGKVTARGYGARENHESLIADNCLVITSPKTYLGSHITWKAGNKDWTPVDVTAEVLKGLKDLVLNKSNAILSEAYFSIPVGFTPEKRRDLRAAAKIAGIKVLGYVSEPTAALFKNHKLVHNWSKVAVFDWGGGTLDISVVEIQGKTVKELAVVGLDVGGDNLDFKIAQWAHSQHMNKVGGSADFHEMPVSVQDQLSRQCENAKRFLASEDNQKIIVTSYGQYGNLIVNLTFEKMHSLLKEEINKVTDRLDVAVLKRAQLSFDDLGCVLMVGGSSKLKGLYEQLAQHVGDECQVIKPAADSDWHIAEGGALLGKEGGSYHAGGTIGIELSDNSFLPLVAAGAEIKHEKDHLRFGLTEDSRTACFNFFEVIDDSAQAILQYNSRRIGSLAVPTQGFAAETINLEYGVDENFFFSVFAKSDHLGDSTSRAWNFSEMRYVYRLPEGA